MNTYGSAGQRTNAAAMPAGPAVRRPGTRPKMATPEPAMATSSMQLPNRAGQKGPGPVKGIVNGMMRRA
jgi:hypothetical protein